MGAGQDGCRTGWVQDRMGPGQDGFRAGWVQDRMGVDRRKVK